MPGHKEGQCVRKWGVLCSLSLHSELHSGSKSLKRSKRAERVKLAIFYLQDGGTAGPVDITSVQSVTSTGQGTET